VEGFQKVALSGRCSQSAVEVVSPAVIRADQTLAVTGGSIRVKKGHTPVGAAVEKHPDLSGLRTSQQKWHP
jgi:CII-binding regulator of phage lambda lysogenization HflD